MSDKKTEPVDYRPPTDILRKLITYKIAVIEDDKYVYSPEIKASVAAMIKNPPGRLQQIRWGNQARRLAGTLVLYASSLKSASKLQTFLLTFANLQYHLKRLNINFARNTFGDVVYATFYLNDHEPEVWEDE